MWLPTPLYEALPYIYVGAGIALIAGANYIGVDSREASLYIGTGSVSVLSGVLVYVRRSIARTNRQQSDGAGNIDAHASTADLDAPKAD